MRQKLFTVKDRFKIAGRGLVITGDYQENSPEIKPGMAIVLITTNETELFAEIAGFENFQTISGHYKGIGILIKNLTKENIPTGTEVFLQT